MGTDPRVFTECADCGRLKGGGNVIHREDGVLRCRSCERKRRASWAAPSDAITAEIVGRFADDVEKLINGATKHAQATGDEFTYAVADLETILRLCWTQLGPAGRKNVLETHEAREILEWLD